MRTARLLLLSGNIVTVNLDHISAAMPGRFGGTSDMTVIFLGSKAFEIDMKYDAFFELWVGTPPLPAFSLKKETAEEDFPE
ncbi:MAG: hypothetical protein AB9917_11800 [Negativicutes bacterium]